MTNGLDLFSSTVLFLCGIVAGIFIIGKSSNDAGATACCRQIFVVAMGLRFAASIGIYFFGLVNVIGDEDASGWQGSLALAGEWSARGLTVTDLPSAWSEALLHPFGNLGYQNLVATLFFLTGTTSRLMAAVLNNFFGAMTVVLAARVGWTLFSPWVGVRVGWWACLMPSLVIWSAQTLKEPVVILLETIAIYACTRLQSSRDALKYVLVCASAAILLVAFRFYATYVTSVAILLSLALPQVRSGRGRFGAALSISLLVIPVLIATGALARHEAAFQTHHLARLQEMRDWTARHAGSGVPMNFDLNTPSGLAMSIAVGSAHLLLAPFPWQLGGANLRTLLTLPELLVWWWLVFAGLMPGLRVAIRARFSQVQPLLYFIIGMAILYGITFSNVGLIFRQRAQLMPWLLVFMMVGLEQRALNAAWRRRCQEAIRGAPALRQRAPVASVRS